MKKLITILTIAIVAIATFSFDTKVKKVAPKHGVIIMALNQKFVTKEFIYAGEAWWICGATVEFKDTSGKRNILKISEIGAIIELDSVNSVTRAIK